MFGKGTLVRPTGMPFQPIPENETPKPGPSDFALLLIRILTTLAFLYYQLVDQLNLARTFIWEKADWPLVEFFTDAGIPYPGVLAVACIVVVLIAFLGIAVGVFTRVNALLLLLLIGAAFLFPLELSRALSPQTFVLYLAVFLGLTLGGGGRLTLDYLFSSRKAGGKKRG